MSFVLISCPFNRNWNKHTPLYRDPTSLPGSPSPRADEMAVLSSDSIPSASDTSKGRIVLTRPSFILLLGTEMRLFICQVEPLKLHQKMALLVILFLTTRSEGRAPYQLVNSPAFDSGRKKLGPVLTLLRRRRKELWVEGKVRCRSPTTEVEVGPRKEKGLLFI